MSAASFDPIEFSQLWANIVALLILAAMSLLLLAVSPWGIDWIYSPLAHFLTLFPLTVLAIVTSLSKIKLDAEERDVPG